FFEGATTTLAGGVVDFNPMTGQIDSSFAAGDYQLFSEVNGGKIVARFMANSNQFAVTPFSAGATSASVGRFAAGIVIGPGLVFGGVFSTLASNFSNPPHGHWNTPPTTGYVGLKFNLNATPFYGW